MPAVEQPSATYTGPAPYDLLQVATEAASVGAELALSWRESAGQLTIEQKTGPSDLVSQADRQVEEAVRSVLSRHRPDDGVLGEEGGEVAGTSGISWVVDPIDGTMSYLYGLPDWTVSIAAADSASGELLAGVVASPVLDRVVAACLGGGTTLNGRAVRVRDTTELSHALVSVNFGRADRGARAGRMVDALLPRVRHVRRGGSTAAALAEVAAGSADAAWSPDAKVWDIAAGVLLVKEAGGEVGDLEGVSRTGWPGSCEALAACPAIWQPLRRLLASAYSD
jgi:myo-inositol-1(or 4)-monophosphatase